jgi:hypothetical protein
MTATPNQDQVAERYRRKGTDVFGTHGSAFEHHRYFEPIDPRSRRRCICGCRKRATHRGMANGVCLITGCELSMARWVRDPASAYRAKAHLLSGHQQ